MATVRVRVIVVHATCKCLTIDRNHISSFMLISLSMFQIYVEFGALYTLVVYINTIPLTTSMMIVQQHHLQQQNWKLHNNVHIHRHRRHRHNSSEAKDGIANWKVYSIAAINGWKSHNILSRKLDAVKICTYRIISPLARTIIDVFYMQS